MKVYKINSKVGEILVACQNDKMLTISKKSITIEKGMPILGGAYQESSVKELENTIFEFNNELSKWMSSSQNT